ncbi:helix-turn-helix domain-containing protein [bacterium]|nr:helix-turn-helix domain-containing protein [bacterium]
MAETNQAAIQVKYLNDKQVARMTGKAVQSLRNERSKRIGIPFIRMGGAVRYDIQDVIKYMEERRIETN